ncbi:unnamed protein product [Lampetra fluviatilis]
MEKKIHEQRNGEKIGTQPGWEAETHGWHRKMKLIPTELIHREGPEWPGELGPSPSPWQGPLCTAAALFAVVLAYSVCRDVVQPYVTSGRSEAHRLPVLIVNRALPATAISLLAFAHLPDVLACLLRARDNDRHRAPPSRWLARWLAARKRLWLLGAGGAALHVAYSLSYPGRLALRYKMLAWSYKQVQEGRATSWDEEDVWRMELYVSLGAMALGALSLLAIAQLPSVRDSLTGRELAYLHDRLGPLALLLSAAHTVVYGWRRWLDAVSYVWCTPPVFLLALLAPCSTLLGMALAAAPCWRRRPALDRGIRAEEEDEEDDKEDEKKDLGQFHTDQDIGIEMTGIFVSWSPESLGSRDPPWPPQSSGDQPLGPALRGEHGNSSGSCGSRAPLLLPSSAAAAGVTESSSSVTSAARTVEEYGPSRPVSSYDDLSSATTLSATRGESISPPPPTSLSRGHEFSSIAELSPSRPRQRRAVYARGHGQATAYGTGPSPGRWHRKPLGWGDFSASVRTARLQLLVTAKMVDQGNGLLSVHFWHNATGREGNLSISLGPHATPLRFSTRGPLASQQPRFQQQQQQHRQHHHQQQHRQHQHRQQQQHHQYQHQQQPRHQQQWNENYQRHHEDEQHPKQQQHQHDQNNQQQQWNEKQLQLKQDEQHDQHKQQEQQPQQAESKESQDTGTFRCRVEYERVDRALKRAPCAEPRIAVSPAGSSPSPGGPGHGPPGVGSTTGGSCYREQVQSHVWWICSKPISAFCIFIAFQDEDYRLAQKVCPDLHASRNPPSG